MLPYRSNKQNRVFSSDPGRLLVGMRWWNEVDESGASKWVFESKKVCIIYLKNVKALTDKLFSSKLYTI